MQFAPGGIIGMQDVAGNVSTIRDALHRSSRISPIVEE
jgi:hypothetical protein